MTSKTDFARHSNNCRSPVSASLVSTSCMKVPLAATTPTRVYSMRRQLAAATSTKLESLSRENPQQTSLAPAPLPKSSLSKSRTMSSTLKAQPIANHVVSACAIANLYHTSDHRQSSPVGCTMAPNWRQPFLSTACSSTVNKSCGHRNSSNSNCLKSYLASVMVFFIFLHQIDLCYPLLPDKSTNTTTAVFGPQSNNAVRQSLDAVLNTRFVRSYSEEFMTSSEERERGLQFFGGTSAGSTSTRHRIAPYFDTESLSTNVTISEGSAFVHLPCRVKQLGERTLSWIRRKDLQILTVGKFTYTSDQRFQAIHLDNSDDWSLLISYPQKKDAGTYECQVATIPKISLFVQLNVVVSKAKIVESPTLYLSSGSTLNLTCVVSDTPEPPDYIFWYYNGQVINYGSPRGIKVHTEKSAQTISKLAISKVQPTDSGNYSCTPSNAEAAHIAVHIHNNANPAASIQHGKRSAREFGNNNGSLNAVSPNQLLIAITYLLTLLSAAQFLQLSANLPMIQSRSLLFSM